MISIIITIYNSEKYLKQCLDSVLNQVYENYEVIMINDGSTDNSRAIAVSYTSDSRFHLIDSFHVGFPQAKNIGLSNVHGDYIIFLDSDDIAHPQWLSLLYKAISENNADISYCSYTKFYDTDIINHSLLEKVSINNMSDQKMCPLFYNGCRNYMWNKLIKSSLYNDIVFEDCPIMSDVQVMYKIFDKANSVYRVDASLIDYRQHSDSICGTIMKTKEFPEYRFSLMVKVISFIYNKYEISRFICRRALEEELFKLRMFSDDYNNIYTNNKELIESIIKDPYICDFDIDLVIPYVDCRDKVWQDAYIKTTGKENYINNDRFDNPDLFEFFLKGVDKFMPWIRTIHLIVSNIEQVPSYINKEKTHIVLHKDIMPEDILPTFNSSTIEMFIHNIEGLSEHFIYANDDMYPISPMIKEDFFTEEGKPKIVFKNMSIEKEETFFNHLCLNVYNHTAETFGIPYNNNTFLRPEHSMSSMILSHCKDCFNKMLHFIKKDLGPFRTMYQHTQYMYLLYERFTKGYSFGGPNCGYHELNSDISIILRDINYRAHKILCLNGSTNVSKDDIIKLKEALNRNLNI